LRHKPKKEAKKDRQLSPSRTRKTKRPEMPVWASFATPRKNARTVASICYRLHRDRTVRLSVGKGENKSKKKKKKDSQ